MFTDLKKDRLEKVYYDHTEYPAYIRRSFLSSYPNYAAPPHWHDDIEFVIVLSGEMTYNVNGKIINLKSGEGIFVNSRQMHFGFSKTYVECEFICIIIHPMMLCLTPEVERKYVASVIHNNHIIYIHLAEKKWHKDIIEGVHKIYLSGSAPAAPLKIQSIFTWIWALVYENMPGTDCKEHPQNHDLSILKNMITFIQQRYHEKITLEQIASSGGIGQSKCCKVFAAYIHQTPNTYLTVYRLGKSTELLCTTDRTITEIAYAVGFSGASYYAEAFRKYFQISPSEYRKNIRTNE